MSRQGKKQDSMEKEEESVEQKGEEQRLDSRRLDMVEEFLYKECLFFKNVDMTKHGVKSYKEYVVKVSRECYRYELARSCLGTIQARPRSKEGLESFIVHINDGDFVTAVKAGNMMLREYNRIKQSSLRIEQPLTERERKLRELGYRIMLAIQSYVKEQKMASVFIGVTGTNKLLIGKKAFPFEVVLHRFGLDYAYPKWYKPNMKLVERDHTNKGKGAAAFVGDKMEKGPRPVAIKRKPGDEENAGGPNPKLPSLQTGVDAS